MTQSKDVPRKKTTQAAGRRNSGFAWRQPTRYFLAWVLVPTLALSLATFLVAPAFTLHAYVLGINLCTFLLFAYDKGAAPRDWLRVPERVLVIVALLGGLPAALLAIVLLRHKGEKLKRFLIR